MWSTSSAARATVARLLAPHTIEEFAQRYYERAPLYVDRSGRDGVYSPYFSLNELERVLYGSELRTKDVRLVRDGLMQRVESYTFSRSTRKADEKKPPSDVIDHDKLSVLFAAGCTAVFDALDTHSITLSNLCRELEAFFGHRVNPNVYLTPAGNQGFAPHYDTHDTLILQIHGTKHWRIYGSAFESPARRPAVRQKNARAAGDSLRSRHEARRPAVHSARLHARRQSKRGTLPSRHARRARGSMGECGGRRSRGDRRTGSPLAQIRDS